ncbi:DUF4190 domain-containing protein [Kitasatospora sp. NPDC051914]|uniref:DUF4190 domain-containing protein n=1 Tax=Kitasatospora sp. NPDC051914 TaxID=3154945 RepID=UPI003424F6F2
MPSDPYSPQPDDRAAQDEAFARAFAPPSPQADPPYGAPPQNPYAPPSPFQDAVPPFGAPQDVAAQDEALARAFAPPSQTVPLSTAPPQPGLPGAVPPGPVPPGAVPVAPWGSGGWGQPGPGYPGWQQPVGPPTAWSGYAIASFVLGVLGLACCMWVGAIAFGVAALRTVKARNERGRGLAIAGISLGGLWAVVLAVVMVLGVVFGDRDPLDGPYETDDTGRTSVSGVYDLAVGECFVKLGSGKGEDVTDVETVDCSEPHYGEVFANPRLTAFVYPGKDRVVADARKSCADALFDYAPDSWAISEDLELHFFYPDQETWALDDDHYATCFLTDTSSFAKGSARQDRTALNEAQLAYLRAENRIDRAFDEQPDAKPAEDPAAYRAWALTLSVAVDREIDDLGKRDWGGVASGPVGALKGELKQALTHLRAARTATDPKVMEQELAKGEELLGFERPEAVRAALGLATGDGPGNSGKGGPNKPGGTRTDRPAPVSDLRPA